MAIFRDRDITRHIPLVADPGARRGSSCPDAKLLAAYADSRLEAAQRSDLEDHLADCSFCLGQVGFLIREAERELPAVPSSLLDAVREPRARWLDWTPRPAWAALAAAAVLVLAAAVVLQLNHGPDLAAPDHPTSDSPGYSTSTPPPDRTVRNGTTSRVALRILEPEEGAVLGGAEIELRWQESPRALQYTVSLVSLQGDLIWEGRTTESPMSVPTATLAAGERYFVWIEALLRGGGTLKSAPVGFRLAPG